MSRNLWFSEKEPGVGGRLAVIPMASSGFGGEWDRRDSMCPCIDRSSGRMYYVVVKWSLLDWSFKPTTWGLAPSVATHLRFASFTGWTNDLCNVRANIWEFCSYGGVDGEIHDGKSMTIGAIRLFLPQLQPRSRTDKDNR